MASAWRPVAGLTATPTSSLRPSVERNRQAARRIHRKIARCRADALHKFSRSVVEHYQRIVVGDVSSPKLVRTRMAKAVLDAGWGRLRTQLLYKGQQAGRSVEVVSERFTTRACSQCGSHSGPQGLSQLCTSSRTSPSAQDKAKQTDCGGMNTGLWLIGRVVAGW